MIRRFTLLFLVVMLCSSMVITWGSGTAQAADTFTYKGLGSAPIRAMCSSGQTIFASGGVAVWRRTLTTGWTFVGCPGGAGTQINDLCSAQGYFFACCSNGHAYRYNSGTKWDDLGNPSGYSLMCMVSTGTLVFTGSATGHVYRYDGGTSWTDYGAPSSPNFVSNLAWRSSPENLFASTLDGVYVFGGGTSWTNLGLSSGGGTVNPMPFGGLCVQGDALYVTGADSYVYRYDNTPKFWSSVGMPGSSGVQTTKILSANWLFAAKSNGELYRYRKAPSGNMWINAGKPGGGSKITSLINVYSNATFLFTGCENGHVYQWLEGSDITAWGDAWLNGGPVPTCFATDGTVVYTGCDDGNVYKYEPSANRWTKITATTHTITSIVYSSYGYLFIGAHDGVWIYKGGTGWTKIVATRTYLERVDSLVAIAGQLWIGCGKYDWRCNIDGTELKMLGQNGNALCASPDALYIYAGGYDGHVYRRNSDAGIGTVVWEDIGTASGRLYYGDHLYAVSGSAVYQYNEGTSWSYAGSTGVQINALYWANGDLYAGCSDGTLWFRSGPTRWTNIGKPGASTAVNCLTAIGSDLYAGTGIGVYTDTLTTKTYQYFAEGCTREGFNEWLCLQNPNSYPIDVLATYMLFGGLPVEKTYTVDPTSRMTVNVNNAVGPGQDVSVKLVSKYIFYAERPMYYNYKAGQEGFSWAGGDCATAVKSPSRDWYFAEGTTRPGFEEWCCIQNPNVDAVTVNIDYVSAGAYTQSKQYDIPAESRISVFVNGDVGPNQDVSLHLHSDKPIIAERPMYFNYHGKWAGGHNVAGTTSPRMLWYFAEGSTQPGFEEWLAVQNANNRNAAITVHFMKTNGEEIIKKYSVGANSRWTLDVGQALGIGQDSAIAIASDAPVVAERPMYFSYKMDTPGFGWAGGHDVVGSPVCKYSWFFPEGCTLPNFEEYICIANPTVNKASVQLTFMLETGKSIEHSLTILPKQRCTLFVPSVVGLNHDVSTRVVSTQPVVAERPMYFNYNNQWSGGSDVVGF